MVQSRLGVGLVPAPVPPAVPAELVACGAAGGVATDLDLVGGHGMGLAAASGPLHAEVEVLPYPQPR